MKRLLLATAALLLAAPAYAQDTDTITFAAFGDYGDGPGATAVANLVEGRNVDYIVTVGDNCYESNPPISQQVGSKYGAWVTAKRFFPTLGNHDYSDGCGGGMARGYLAYFDLPNNERYYDVRVGNVHWFLVNSAAPPDPSPREPDGTGPTSNQAAWFKSKIQGSDAPWKIAVMHYPPFSSGDHGNTPRMQWPWEAWGIDAVIAGHDHNYERIMRDENADGRQLPYFVSGLGGKSIRPFGRTVTGSVVRFTGEYGALFAAASPTTLTFEFRTVGGTVVDSYLMTKAATTQPLPASETPTPTGPVAPPPTNPATRPAFEFRIPPPNLPVTRPRLHYDIAPLLDDRLSNTNRP